MALSISQVFQKSIKSFDRHYSKLWEISHNRTKNNKTHLIPLNEIALALLKELQEITGTSKWLFPKLPATKPGKANDEPYMPITTLSRALTRFCKKYNFIKFNPRDLRRTCKTRMGELGLSKEIRDRLHNHALSDVSSKHYDRYDYLPEKKKAINAWGSHLSNIITTRNNNNIIPIHASNQTTGR